MMEPLKKVRRVGVLGGSFDPVHIGHLIIAQDAVEKLELDEVIFIPAAVPPHKQHLQRADDEHRLNMLRIAVEADLRFSVSDIELQRGGVSYTIDTVRSLQQVYPDTRLVLIVGSDTLVDLHSWYKIDELLGLCEVASLMRPGECCSEAISEKLMLSDEQCRQLLENVLEAHLVDVSSTEIRMRIAEGLRIRYLVPPEVEMYIFEHGLYRG